MYCFLFHGKPLCDCERLFECFHLLIWLYCTMTMGVAGLRPLCKEALSLHGGLAEKGGRFGALFDWRFALYSQDVTMPPV